MSASKIGLLVIAILIPMVGFIMTIGHAKKGETRQEQRWRKSHGLLFWSLAPGVAGLITVLGFLEILPNIFTLLGIIILGFSTFLSWSLQRKHEEEEKVRSL